MERRVKTETLAEFLARGGVIQRPAFRVTPPLSQVLRERAVKNKKPSLRRKAPVHGSIGMYNNQGCRCELCTKARRDYMRGYLNISPARIRKE